ncbi:MAG: 4'-phosphopantetheinyl transferase family protein [Micromonosporaceae bacterium]
MNTSRCEIYWASPADADPRLTEFLDETESARLARFVQEADQARYLVSHALARLAVARALQMAPAKVLFSRTCRRCGGDHGKPQPPAPAELSISHSGQRVAVAVTSHTPVGVDVEQVDRRLELEQLAPSILTPYEQTELSRLPADARQDGLLRYWTRKEAVLKATGYGLMVAPDTIAVSAPDQPPRLVSWAAPDAQHPPASSQPATSEPTPGGMRLLDIDPDGDHVACVAFLSDTAPTVTQHHDPFGSGLI